MVKVGDVYWEAEVRGVADAQEASGGLQDSFEGVAESAIGSATAQEEASDATESNTEATEENERWTQRATTAKGLLSSALFFLGSNFGIASAAATVYSGAVGLATFATSALTGAVGTLYAAVAGPAGIAAGLALATIGVGLLGAELLGLTDVTPVVESETDTMTGLFADMAFLIGGPLVGFLGAAFLALTGDFTGAKNMFINTSVEWIKAATRFGARVKLGFIVMWNAIEAATRKGIETLDFLWRAGWNGLLGITQDTVNGISQAIVDGLEGAINTAVGPLNDLISKVNDIPHVNVGSVGTADFGEVQPLEPGAGMVENEDLDSRLARVQEQEEQDVREAAEQTRRELEQYAPDTISADERTSTGQGRDAFFPGEDPDAVAARNRRRRQGAETADQLRDRGRSGAGTGDAAQGGGGGVQEQNISVEIGDQSIDLSQLNRQERRDLASLIGDELGGQTGNISGVR